MDIVRIAKEPDRQEVWRLCLQAHQENGLFPLSVEKVDWWINRALRPDLIGLGDTGARVAIAVIGDIGSLEAMVIISFGSLWYSTEKYLEEMILYVDPEYRKTTHAKSLVKWMQFQAYEMGMPLVTGVVSNKRTEAKCRFYSRMLPKAGEFFMYRPNGHAPV